MTKTIFGGEVKTPAGYCCLHNGAVTVKQIKKRACVDKHCKHLQRNFSHPWWGQEDHNG